MKKSLTEEWQDIKKARESCFDDLSNPLGEFLAKIPKDEREQVLDYMFPLRHEQACLNNIRASLRNYRRVQYYYIRPIKPDLLVNGNTEEKHRASQKKSLAAYRKGIKEQIVKLRELRASKSRR